MGKLIWEENITQNLGKVQNMNKSKKSLEQSPSTI